MDHEIQEILQRLEALETEVFRNRAPLPKTKAGDYAGPRGGILLLLQEGVFKSGKELKAVRQALAERGYHYSRQAVHNALDALSKAGGPLVVLKEKKRKYVERK